MKKTYGCIAITLGICAWPMAASATLIGDTVTLSHHDPDKLSTSSACGVFPGSITVAAGDSDNGVVYCSYPYGYNVNVEADSILIDYTHLYLSGVTGTWPNTEGCIPSYDPVLEDWVCVDTPMTFNGLHVSDLDDSSGSPLLNVVIDTNMAGWNNSMLSFGSDDVWFNWMGLSFDGDTYFNAQLTFGGPAPSPVPEPATLLLLGSGIAGIGGLLRRRTRNTDRVTCPAKPQGPDC